jgi:excisionase family DNA binding protein
MVLFIFEPFLTEVSMSELLTIQEMAERLKVPVSWLYARTRQTGPGTIPRIKVGKYLRFEEAKVMEWLERAARPVALGVD